jgi:hypothetical protein
MINIMGKFEKLQGSVAIAGLGYTIAQTIKCIQETRAIVIPPRLPKETPPSSSPNKADLTEYGLPNHADLVLISRSFPYAKSASSKGTQTDLVDSGLYNPDIPFKWRPVNPRDEISLDSFDPNLFDANIPPNFLTYETSAYVAQLGKLLFQIGIG